MLAGAGSACVVCVAGGLTSRAGDNRASVPEGLQLPLSQKLGLCNSKEVAEERTGMDRRGAG